MKFSSPLPYITSVLLLLAVTTSASLNLFDLQPIIRFPNDCSSAYNVEILSCTREEVTRLDVNPSGRGICSSECIASLTIVNRNLLSECRGLSADPSTLIGIFFAGKGVAFLCPNSVDGGQPAPSSTEESSSSEPTSSSSISSSSSSSSSSSETSTTESPTPTTESSSSSSSTSTTVTPTFQPTTVVNNGTPSIITSQAQQTEAAQSNPNAFGGGGSPFEVAENDASRLGKHDMSTVMAMVAAIMCGVMVMAYS